jgi:predicted dienelactone hydrolase
VKPARDDRIKASIAFSPNARIKVALDKQFGSIKIPFFSVTGTKDGSVLDDKTTVEDRLVPYQKMPAGEKYLTVFEGGDHMVFGGHVLNGRRPETPRDREIQTDVKAATLAFWNSTLKQDATAKKWLASQADDGFKSMLLAGDVFENK